MISGISTNNTQLHFNGNILNEDQMPWREVDRGNTSAIFFVEISGNYSPYSLFKSEEEEKFRDFIFAYGANASVSLFLFKKNAAPFFIGLDGNYQYDRYNSMTELDLFKQKQLFDLFTTSAGLSIGYEFDSFSDYNAELILKGGLILNAFVEQKISSDNFQILTTQPYGKYIELQINATRYKGIGFFVSSKLWFEKEIISNVNSIFSINDLNFNIPPYKLTFKLGIRLGLF